MKKKCDAGLPERYAHRFGSPRLPKRAARKTRVAAHVIRRLERQLAEAHARINELQTQAETDGLLNVLNRRGLERELARALAYIVRYGATAALIYLDIDKLKPVNDTYGHAAGDEVLKAVVGLLRQHVRASDVVARVGGDEFVLLLWHLTEADALAKATMLEATIDGLSVAFHDRTLATGASAGIAVLAPGMDVQAALAKADRAMYQRKECRRSVARAAAVVTAC